MFKYGSSIPNPLTTCLNGLIFSFLMQHEIKLINDERSDISPYGATNEAEFFAVVSAYFFERPKLLKKKDPAFYDLLEKVFCKQPVE